MWRRGHARPGARVPAAWWGARAGGRPRCLSCPRSRPCAAASRPVCRAGRRRGDGDDPLVSNQTAADLRAALVGRRVVALRRRGKYLIIELEGMLLVVHLRMTGRLLLAPEPGGRAPRFVAHLRPDAELLFYDTRRFGRVWAVPAADENAFFAALGPEPFSDAVHEHLPAPSARGPHGAAQVVPARPAAYRRRGQHLRRRDAVPGTAAPAAHGRHARPRRDPAPARRPARDPAARHRPRRRLDRPFVDPHGASGDFQAMLNVYGRTRRAVPGVRHADRSGRARWARHALLPGLPGPAARQATVRRRPRGAGPRARRAPARTGSRRAARSRPDA